MKRIISILMIVALLGGMSMFSVAGAAPDENLYQQGKEIALSKGDILLIGPYDANEMNLGDVDGTPLAPSSVAAAGTFAKGQKLYAYTTQAACTFIPKVADAYESMFLAKKVDCADLSVQDYYAYWDDRGANLYNETLDGINGYMNSFTNRNSIEKHRCTHFVAVEEGDTITFGPANPDQGFHAVGLKSDGSVADSEIKANEMRSVSSEKIRNDKYDFVFYTYKVPAGMAYISIINYTPVQSMFVALKNQPALNPDSYYAFLGAIENNPLYGKTALFVGDSISFGEADVMQKNKDQVEIRLAWAGRVGLSNGLTYTNASVSGASLSTMRGANARILNQINNKAGNRYDFVVIHGGVNDAWGNYNEGYIPAPIGKMTEGFDSAYDKTTYAGGLEETIAAAKRNFPDAKLIYIMNFKASACEKGTVSDMSAYFAEGAKICKKWGVTVCDLYSRFDFNDPYYTDEKMIHINQYGYDLVYPHIAAAMKASVQATEVNAYIESFGMNFGREDIPAMDAARRAYDLMGEDVRAYVENYAHLLAAEGHMKGCPAGDADADGRLGLSDILLLLRHKGDHISLDKLNYYVADFNGDGKLDTADAVEALRELLKK